MGFAAKFGSQFENQLEIRQLQPNAQKGFYAEMERSQTVWAKSFSLRLSPVRFILSMGQNDRGPDRIWAFPYQRGWPNPFYRNEIKPAMQMGFRDKRIGVAMISITSMRFLKILRGD